VKLCIFSYAKCYVKRRKALKHCLSGAVGPTGQNSANDTSHHTDICTLRINNTKLYHFGHSTKFLQKKVTKSGVATGRWEDGKMRKWEDEKMRVAFARGR
jgi:hypothetical protein